ncbi:hypothetical protein WH95_01825 [Kiloniella litopenaei]|uniref:Uncharacterized protein n=1 Tax=Kiloniella litopenaei TaxID=1549748 RepID=A0A0M2R881_9PROT|nr:hypothetical protein WH95_01825 [Kiloniella litopenaei]
MTMKPGAYYIQSELDQKKDPKDQTFKRIDSFSDSFSGRRTGPLSRKQLVKTSKSTDFLAHKRL